MKWLNFSNRMLCEFVTRSEASTLPIMGAIMIPLMGFVGLATDAARGYVVKIRLHDALDAAGLAAAHEVDSSNFQQQFASYFYANFPQGYMGAQVVLDPPDPSNLNREIAYSARATIDTTFMGLLGLDTLHVSSFTQVSRSTVSMDVVLSIDMSGSMAGSRIEAAREASISLLDILYGSGETNDLLQVGLVPWNANVNVAIDGMTYNPSLTESLAVDSFTNPITGDVQNEIFMTNVSPVPFLSAPPSSWEGCAYARYTNDDASNDGDAQVGIGTFGSSVPLDWMAWQPNSDATHPNCLGHGITPLQRNKSTIATAINDLTSPDSYTNIAQGLAWAWRVLSPTAPFEEANPNPKGNHQRAIVLLTDGEQVGSDYDGYNAVFGTGSEAGPNGMDDRLRAVADSAKAAGIKVFVIQYEFDSGPLRSLLEGVASGPTTPYYHFAPDAAALEVAFQEIANELTELRISQ